MFKDINRFRQITSQIEDLVKESMDLIPLEVDYDETQLKLSTVYMKKLLEDLEENHFSKYIPSDSHVDGNIPPVIYIRYNEDLDWDLNLIFYNKKDSDLNSEFLGVLFFVALTFGLIHMDLNSNVNVTICESNGLTTYVSRSKPNPKIKVGSCKSETMIKHEYYTLKKTISNIHYRR